LTRPAANPIASFVNPSSAAADYTNSPDGPKTVSVKDANAPNIAGAPFVSVTRSTKNRPLQ
jgi:hypothetical protein